MTCLSCWAAVLLVSPLAALAVFVALRVRWYRKLFRLPSRRDDSFNCLRGDPAVPISLDPDGLAVPAAASVRNRTAFLSVDVRSTWLGFLFDPYVEVAAGAVLYRQYFERGARGRRHLNLSPVFQGEGTSIARVHLRGRFVRWGRRGALVLFAAPPVREAEVLVLAPHPDDAEIAAFGMYAQSSSWVVTITAGEGGMADLAVVPRGLPSARWNALVRVWDSLTIPQLGGVPQERCVNLVYPDNQLGAMYQRASGGVRLACEGALSRAKLRSRNRAPEFRAGSPDCTWEGLVDELQQILEMTRPDIVICPHPVIDGHHDHVFTAVALDQAARRVPSSRRLFLLYVVHRRDAPLYPFGSPKGPASLPPWSDETWLADSIYSHPLSSDLRLAKYFAIEATHDLRTYSAGEPRTIRQALVAMKRELGALVGGGGLPAATFIRRGPRPNEIYSVVSPESFAELVKRALARYPTTHDGHA